MKKGKIIIVNHYGITPDVPGSTRHYDMAKAFSEKKDYLIEFWMCGLNHLTGEYAPQLKGLKLQYKYKDSYVRIVKIKSTPYRNGKLFRQLNIIFFDFITGLKVLFGRDIKCIVLSMPPITIFTTFFAKCRNISIVADVEDLWPLFLQDMGMNNKFVVSYMEHLANYTYNSAVAVESVSEGMLSFVRKKLKDKDKKSWLSPLGIELSDFGGNPDPDYIKGYAWKDNFKIIYAGAHGKANDIEAVLKTVYAFNKLFGNRYGKEVSFIFIGSGENKHKIVKLAEKLQLTNVYFEDAVPGKRIPGIIKNADVCLTNLQKIESFQLVRPNKIFQYMAAKKPILCGIWGEARKIVEQSGAGMYIDFTDAKKSARDIFAFISQENLNEYGMNGYHYVKEHGDRKKIFEEFYHNLTGVIR